MKIVLTGGGTGGHFYPLIAVTEAVRRLTTSQKLVTPEFYYLAPTPYNDRLLFESGINFTSIPAGKWRRYFSFKNFWDLFVTLRGFVKAFFRLYAIYPDVIFSKGGYASFPTLLAGRCLRIPIVIHESDSTPGRVSLWSGKFARYVALSYPEAAQFFPTEKTAVTGNPIRQRILTPIHQGAREFLELRQDKPIILVIGGSQGATALNDALLDILPSLLTRYQIVHQTGVENLAEVESRVNYLLDQNPGRAGYKVFPYLNGDALQMAAGAAELVITRAGSFLFEVAAWGLPAIVIPIPEPLSHDQRRNAFTYARAGAATVIEQNNLTPSVLEAEIDHLMDDNALRARMAVAAKQMSRTDAAEIIAKALISIALQHEV